MMRDPFAPPASPIRDFPEEKLPARRSVHLWVVACYSVLGSVGQLFSIASVYMTDSYAWSLPMLERYYSYLIPSVLLAAGIALFRLAKEAFYFYVAHFMLHLGTPLAMSSVYANPYFGSTWQEIYAKAAHTQLPIAWAVSALLLTYSFWLFRRRMLT